MTTPRSSGAAAAILDGSTALDGREPMSRALSPYLAVLSARFRTLLQYRAAAAAGFGTQLFWGLIRVMIFSGFFASTSRRQPMTYEQTLTYIWLGQAMFALLPLQPDADVRALIRSGAVAYELARPVDLYGLWYARALAARTAPTLLRAIPMLVVAVLWLGMKTPPSWGAAAGWLLATCGAALLAAAFSTLITVSLLWTVSGEGASRLAPVLAYACSGILLPLQFFPRGVQAIVNALPFRDTMDVPFRIYLGTIPAAQAPAWLAHQAAWIAALVILGRAALARGMSRVVVQGG